MHDATKKKTKKPPVAQPQRVLILLSLHRLGKTKKYWYKWQKITAQQQDDGN